MEFLKKFWNWLLGKKTLEFKNTIVKSPILPPPVTTSTLKNSGASVPKNSGASVPKNSGASVPKKKTTRKTASGVSTPKGSGITLEK
jgi:hypothetical protein